VSADGQFKVEALLFGDGRHGEALMDESAAACLFDVTDANVQVEGAPGLVSLSFSIGRDGSHAVSRPISRADNAVAFSGSLLGPGQLAGVYRGTNEVTGCDSGAIPLSSA